MLEICSMPCGFQICSCAESRRTRSGHSSVRTRHMTKRLERLDERKMGGAEHDWAGRIAHLVSKDFHSLVISPGRAVVSSGRILLSGGRIVISDGRVVISVGRVVISDGSLVISTGRISGGRFVISAGWL